MFDLQPSQRHFLATLSRLIFSNPFLPERIALEREALGDDFHDAGPVWSLSAHMTSERTNVVQLGRRAAALARLLREQLAAGASATRDELALYEDLVLYHLYDQFRDRLHATVSAALTTGPTPPRVPYWDEFLAEFTSFFRPGTRSLAIKSEPAHLFACLFQIRRAFHHIHDFLVGGSLPAARLRGAVWESVFTHDMRRYRRSLYHRMGDVTTLVCGPSGTGKELVARAVGFSRYIPFSADNERFAADFHGSFHPLNLSALSPTLIESELFGHYRGSFTGAVSDRVGWLDICRPLGTVFLDEIGELDPAIQVKLLRVLQGRVFQRLGETADRRFAGKIIAATNRDLSAEMRAGRFREDFYYRLCSDAIETPTLREQLAAAPHDLRNLALFVARRVSGEEAEPLADEAVAWIEHNLPADYAWPGNFRELEQCVRSVLIRRAYRPARHAAQGASASLSMLDETRAALAADFAAAHLPADEMLRRYCTLAYARLGSYEETARHLGLDRRTVKSRIDPALLAQLQNDG